MQESYEEEPDVELKPAITRELYTATFEEALDLVQAARKLGFGFEFRNRQDADGDEGFDVILFDDVPTSVD